MRVLMRILLVVLTGTVGCLGGAAHAAPGAAKWHPRGKIVYAKHGSIWSSTIAGRHRKRLTRHHIDGEPTWSANGRRIAFIRNAKDRYGDTYPRGIFVMRANGTHVHRIVKGYIYDPAWSPNGTWIAYAKTGRNHGIYRVRPNGTHRHRITRHKDFGPSWSPGGRWLAYSHETDGRYGSAIRRVRVDGSHGKRLAVGSDFEPAWSPDGTTVMYSDESDLFSSLRSMRPDGSHKRRVRARNLSEPAWSPSGRSIVAVRFVHTSPEWTPHILVARANGSHLHRVPGGKGGEDPDWTRR